MPELNNNDAEIARLAREYVRAWDAWAKNTTQDTEDAKDNTLFLLIAAVEQEGR